jgi:hypothetical protein
MQTHAWYPIARRCGRVAAPLALLVSIFVAAVLAGPGAAPVAARQGDAAAVGPTAVDPCQAIITEIASLERLKRSLQQQLRFAAPGEKPGIITQINEVNAEIAAQEAALAQCRADNPPTPTPTPTPSPTLPSYHVDTGMRQDFDGDCQARAAVTYYPAIDRVHIDTTVTSPYWFAACRVHTHVWVVTTEGQFPSAVHFAMACAVRDPNCPATQRWVADYDGHTAPLRGQITGIRVAFSKA